MNDLNLDGRRFAMVSSTASEVNTDAPTIFSYHEIDGLVWGDYTGDTVVHGRMVGARDGENLRISYAHTTKGGGAPATGSAEIRIEREPDGPFRLVESFSFDDDDAPHLSICKEI